MYAIYAQNCENSIRNVKSLCSKFTEIFNPLFLKTPAATEFRTTVLRKISKRHQRATMRIVSLNLLGNIRSIFTIPPFLRVERWDLLEEYPLLTALTALVVVAAALPNRHTVIATHMSRMRSRRTAGNRVHLF